jgi:hypothetical protein
VRRHLATLGVLVGIATTGCVNLPAAAPLCDDFEVLALLAQSVPAATELPCLALLPDGWKVQDLEVTDERAVFALGHAVAGAEIVQVILDEDCIGVDGNPLADPPDVGADDRRVETTATVYEGMWIRRSEGACITTHIAIGSAAWPDAVGALEPMLTTISRETVAARLRTATAGRLELDG